MTLRIGALLGAALLFALAVGFAAPASAQATRTWVSGVGDDLNPCSRTAPCRTFAGAHGKTAAGGEINCLDSGMFGMFTITKSISVICDDAHGGIEAVETDEGYVPTIIIDAGPTDTVLISGLTIQGNYRAGQGGILMTSGGALHVRNSTFYALGDCAVGARNVALVTVDNITSVNNFCGVGLGATTAGNFRFALSNLTIDSAIRFGVAIGTSSPAAAMTGVVAKSGIVRTSSPTRFDFAQHGISVDARAGRIDLEVDDVVLANHIVAAIGARGSGAQVAVKGSSITNNVLGIATQDGASVASARDNIFAGNQSNGSFTGGVVKK
ncbi:MAG: hypothetical protein JNL35_08320 [Sphingopyxis sp.]|nr:hypothetical protein [Sphingopyxis sp.]